MTRSIQLLAKIVVLKFVIIACTQIACAEETTKPYFIGEWRNLNSKILGEQRSLIIGKPRSYEISEKTYPVLILLDGDDHFHHVTATTRFLAANGHMPEVLVVGIPNTDRTRDLTPKSQNLREVETRPTHGGADNFITFIHDELLPWLNKEYRTRNYTILVGHSLGGLFAIQALTTRPEVFDAYIAISPSLHWNNQHLIEQTESFLKTHLQLGVDLYLCAGNEGGSLVGGVQKLAGLFTENSPSEFKWKFDLMSEESHSSITLRAVYQGLESIFNDWYLQDPQTTFELGGMDALIRFYKKSSEKYGVERSVPGGLLTNLTFRLIQQNRVQDAADILTYDRSIFQPPAVLISYVADEYKKQGNTDKAAKFYSYALEVDPTEKNARAGLISLGKDSNVILDSQN